jgi:putative ABC transport system permease protein
MERSLRELAYALRQLRRSPAFTLMAVLTLGFGIGSASAIFSIVEGVLLRPLPFPDPSRLVVLADIVEGIDYGGDTPGVTAPGVRAYMRDTTSFSDLGGYQPSAYELSGDSKYFPNSWRFALDRPHLHAGRRRLERAGGCP